MSNTVDILVGARLSERRKHLGLSRVDLALLLDVTVDTLTDLENGRQRLGLELLADAAQLLRLPMSAFFLDENTSGPAGGGPGAWQACDDGSPTDVARLLHAFESIADADHRASVIALAERYASAATSAPPCESS